MSNPALHNLIRKRREGASAVSALVGAFGTGLAVEGPDGELLLGERGGAGPRCPVTQEGEHLGWVSGNGHAAAVASLLGHLAAREAERKTLASEVLHLYREVNLIYSFSEKLASTLDLDTVAALTLDQARHLIIATDGAVMLLDEATGRPRPVATFGEVYRRRRRAARGPTASSRRFWRAGRARSSTTRRPIRGTSATATRLPRSSARRSRSESG